MKYYIIWPEKRWVAAQQIRIWYSDATENNELDLTEIGHSSPNKMAMALHRAGIITLGAQTHQA